MKAIILCAGDGTRLYPLTANTPKPLVPLLDRVILEYVLDAIPPCVDEVYLVVKPAHAQAFDVFLRMHEFPFPVYITLQMKETTGTLSALSAMSEQIGESEKFLVMNGDDIFLQEDVELFATLPTPTCAVAKKIIDARYRTCDINQERRTITTFRPQTTKEVGHPVVAFTGMYLLSGEFFKLDPVMYNGEYSIPDTVFGRYEEVGSYEVSSWHQVNTLEDYQDVKTALGALEQGEDSFEEEL